MKTFGSQIVGIGGAMSRDQELAPPAANPPRQVNPYGGLGDVNLARVIPILPYVIRSMVEKEQVSTARRLIEFALGQGNGSPELLRWRQLLAPPRFLGSRPGPSGPDRSREARWLAENARAHRGQWVAVEGDRLLGASESLKDLQEHLEKMDPPPQSLLHWVE